MSGSSRNFPGEKRRKEVRLKITRARQMSCTWVCRGAGDKSSHAATSRGAGDKGWLTISPAAVQGLAAAPRGERRILEVWISERPYRKKAVIE